MDRRCIQREHGRNLAGVAQTASGIGLMSWPPEPPFFRLLYSALWATSPRFYRKSSMAIPPLPRQLLPLVYDELRKLAATKLSREKPGQTLQATALVHEAYLRLVNVDEAQKWNSRGHFFGAAAEAMRRILINHAPRQGHV